jgi:hypothetical protein
MSVPQHLPHPHLNVDVNNGTRTDPRLPVTSFIAELISQPCTEYFVFQIAIQKLKVKIYKTRILPVVLNGCELGRSH